MPPCPPPECAGRPARCLAINDMAIYPDVEYEREVVWRNHSEDVEVARTGGRRQAAFLIELDVDDAVDLVCSDLGQTGDLRGLERAIAVLQRVRDTLVEVCPEGSRVGRCMALGEWGRCTGDDGHDGGHRLPTESDWRGNNMIPSEGVSPAFHAPYTERAHDRHRGTQRLPDVVRGRREGTPSGSS